MHLPFVEVTRFRLTLVGNFSNLASPSRNCYNTPLLTATGKSISDVEIAMNSDLENLRKWLIANKLSLNVAKTAFC